MTKSPVAGHAEHGGSFGATPVALAHPAATQAATGPFRIPSLDGIRAVSFMLVFVSHVGLGHIIPGGLGVTIFFFLSGYLITTLLRLERDRTSRVSLRDFYLRRAFRILPPFYTVLVLAVLLTQLGLLPERLRASSVISQFAHISNYWFVFVTHKGYPAGTVVYWSLAVEEHFYLVFPAVFVFLQRVFPGRARAQAGVLVTLCLMVLVWRSILTLFWNVDEVRLIFSSDTRIDSILWGCTLALLGNPKLDAPSGSERLWKWVFLPCGLILLAGSLVYRAPWFRGSLRFTLQGIALIPLFVSAIRFPDWGAMRWLNRPLISRVGVWSYSLYLCHQVVIALLEQLFPRVHIGLLALPALVTSLLVAAAVERWVERPTARSRRAYVSNAWLTGTSEKAPASRAP